MEPRGVLSRAVMCCCFLEGKYSYKSSFAPGCARHFLMPAPLSRSDSGTSRVRTRSPRTGARKAPLPTMSAGRRGQTRSGRLGRDWGGAGREEPEQPSPWSRRCRLRFQVRGPSRRSHSPPPPREPHAGAPAFLAPRALCPPTLPPPLVGAGSTGRGRMLPRR